MKFQTNRRSVLGSYRVHSSFNDPLQAFTRGDDVITRFTSVESVFVADETNLGCVTPV